MLSKENLNGLVKKSTVVYSESVHTFAKPMNCVNGEVPVLCDNSNDKENTKLTLKVKASVKAKVYSDNLEEQRRHLDTLIK